MRLLNVIWLIVVVNQSSHLPAKTAGLVQVGRYEEAREIARLLLCIRYIAYIGYNLDNEGEEGENSQYLLLAIEYREGRRTTVTGREVG